MSKSNISLTVSARGWFRCVLKNCAKVAGGVPPDAVWVWSQKQAGRARTDKQLLYVWPTLLCIAPELPGTSRSLRSTKQEKLLCFGNTILTPPFYHPQHFFTAFFNLYCCMTRSLACAQGTAPREVWLMTASHGKAYSTSILLESLRETECENKAEENTLFFYILL